MFWPWPARKLGLYLEPAYGYSFDICAKSHELALANRLVQAAPEVQFILDHCGVGARATLCHRVGHTAKCS